MIATEAPEAAVAAAPEYSHEAPTEAPHGRRRTFSIFFGVLGVIALGALLYWLHARQLESTDDAFVETHLGPVSARIEGTVSKVYVENDQYVHAGDPLVDLDPRDNKIALDQAVATLNQARSQVLAQQPNVPIAKVESGTNVSSAQAQLAGAQAALASAEMDHQSALARLAEAEANNTKAQADLARYQALVSKSEVSQRDFDQVEAAAKAQDANLLANRASADSAARVVEQRKAQVQETQSRLEQYRNTSPQLVAIREAMLRSEEANSQSAEAQLEEAKLKLDYTRIIAPTDGIVMKRAAEVGAHVSPGQQLLTIAQTGDLWITANFKETQLSRLRPKQSVRIHVDALGRDFDGYVETIGGATGAVASVLPPENATGNFVKVVQRIPVRLRFNPGQPGLDLLRAGMSAEATVQVTK
jgi:membrane fusion protein, multidrug efflux system